MAECETSFSLILEGKTMHQPDQIIEMMKDQLDKKLEGYQIEKIHTLSILHDENGEIHTDLPVTDEENKVTEVVTSGDELTVSSLGSDDHAIIEEPIEVEVQADLKTLTLEDVSSIDANSVPDLCEPEKDNELGIVLAQDHIVFAKDEIEALFDEFENFDVSEPVQTAEVVKPGTNEESGSDADSIPSDVTDTTTATIENNPEPLSITEEETPNYVEESSSALELTLEEPSSGYATVSPVKRVKEVTSTKEFILDVSPEDAALITDSGSTTSGGQSVDSPITSPQKLITVSKPVVKEELNKNDGAGWNDSDDEKNKANITVDGGWKDSDDEAPRPKSRIKEKSTCSDSGGSQCGDIRQRVSDAGSTEWKPRESQSYNNGGRDMNRRNRDDFRFNDRDRRDNQYNKAPGSERRQNYERRTNYDRRNSEFDGGRRENQTHHFQGQRDGAFDQPRRVSYNRGNQYGDQMQSDNREYNSRQQRDHGHRNSFDNQWGNNQHQQRYGQDFQNNRRSNYSYGAENSGPLRDRGNSGCDFNFSKIEADSNQGARVNTRGNDNRQHRENRNYQPDGGRNRDNMNGRRVQSNIGSTGNFNSSDRQVTQKTHITFQNDHCMRGGLDPASKMRNDSKYGNYNTLKPSNQDSVCDDGW